MGDLCLCQKGPNVISVEFDDHRFRVIERDDRIWFIADELAIHMKLDNVAELLDALDDDERGSGTLYGSDGSREVDLVSESGFHKIVARSNSPAAKSFGRRIKREVIPMIHERAFDGGMESDDYIPSDPAALRYFFRFHEQTIEMLEDKVMADEPKVAFYDDFANSEGMFSLKQTGKMLGEGPNDFVDWLKAKRFVIKEDSHLMPYARYQRRGIFKVVMAARNKKARLETFVTPKGVQYFASKLATEKFAYLNKAKAKQLPVLID